MFERFTAPARLAVVLAQEEARELRHPVIGTEHLLVALSADLGAGGEVLRAAGATPEVLRADLRRLVPEGGTDGPLDGDALRSLGIDLDDVRRSVEDAFGEGALDEPPESRRGLFRRGPGRPPLPKGHIPFSRRAKKCLELALREAVQLRSGSIQAEHLLLGILREGQGLGVRLLGDRGVDLAQMRVDLTERLRRSA